MRLLSLSKLLVLAAASIPCSACVERAAPEPTGREQTTQASAEPAKSALPDPTLAKPKPAVVAAAGDPEKGNFTLEEATQGLPGKGKLKALIDTSEGKLTCELYEEKAPTTVANFVGLARGTRAWKHEGEWVKKPLYDGTVFHRVIKGFMIQGGDPNKDGSGGPGFQIPDEIWEGAKHNERGQLCMANRGPNTNGSQFFIMDGSAPHLDGGYTIFGKCSPESVIIKLASAKTVSQRAVEPTKIQKITIERDAI